MKIYTSYYNKMKSYGTRYTLIQVSNSKPTGFPWGTWPLKEVYPDWETVKKFKAGEISQDEFTLKYKEKLSRMDKDTVLSKINEIWELGDQQDVILLCWEGSNQFCHRHILAEWLNCDVEEW